MGVVGQFVNTGGVVSCCTVTIDVDCCITPLGSMAMQVTFVVVPTASIVPLGGEQTI
jgi:hypothetical protein